MKEQATYTFLPWLRQGMTNEIEVADGDARAYITIDVTIKGDKIDVKEEQIESSIPSRKVQIYGPGDIVGISNKAIVKTEPQNWITNFEPNYLPYIEFYEEDFPWRYSPFPNPDDHRLSPWLALIVLKEGEFQDGKNIKDKPLPFIKLTSQAKLQDPDQLWAWAHVHANRSLIEEIRKEETTNDIAKALKKLLDEDPDLAYSRIVCPRRLEENEAYHAFLVPAFESGRVAGLGKDPVGVAFDTFAWTNDSKEGLELPYYHRWYFRTGTVGDFEYLVRLLEPKAVDNRVGLRDMDVQEPGANLKWLSDPERTDKEDELQGILKLGGALKVPDRFYDDDALKEVNKYRNWATPFPHPFQENLAAFINLRDSYEAKEAKEVNGSSGIVQAVNADNSDTEYDITNNPDPLITAPLYGRWHAMTQRLLEDREGKEEKHNYSWIKSSFLKIISFLGIKKYTKVTENWVHELNLDPRWRVVAGFGTKVVQENQENYMKAAWDQVGDVLEANKKTREAQLAEVVSGSFYDSHLRHIKEKNPDKWLSLTSPVHKRIVSVVTKDKESSLKTIFYQKQESRLTTAATSVNTRKIMRPKGKHVKRLPFEKKINTDNFVTRINTGKVNAAPPKEIPAGIQTIKDLIYLAKPSFIPKFIIDLMGRHPWVRWVPLVLALIIATLLALIPSTLAYKAIAGVASIILTYLHYLLNQVKNLNGILEDNQSPESVDKLPQSPDFRISQPSENFRPAKGKTDSEEAVRFKKALKDVNKVLQESTERGKVKERPALEIAKVNEAIYEKLNPVLTIPRALYSEVKLPPGISEQQKEQFTEAKVYPRFDLPMYKPLAAYSAELFLPNINYVQQNSISLLETNQKFIEAYMVGLNHEFSRELLWREYPTDQRGSYFRQFWDVSGFMDTEAIEADALKKRFKKILDERNMPELQRYYEQFETLAELSDEEKTTFLAEAKERLRKEELKDIKPLHYWSKSSKLGDHDNRELYGDKEEEVVLVIRGELLKKYPTAVIYAHKAVWQTEDEEPVLDDSQTIDPSKGRTLMPIPEEQENNLPTTIIKSPLYEAKVEPDIYFFGFDFTVCEAKGGTGEKDKEEGADCKGKVQWNDAGWFLVIKERPGEPRFGLDMGNGGNVDDENGKIALWNDLSWEDITPTVEKGGFLQITIETPTITVNQSLENDDERANQQNEDKNITWSKDMNSAELAYILYQVPVLLAVHAREMIPEKPEIN